MIKEKTIMKVKKDYLLARALGNSGTEYEARDKSILKYVPKSKLSAIRSCWKDSDGYWITLNDEWNADRTDWNCHTIHEDSIAQLRYQIAGISRRENE
ncbi:MAG: hypothetical protein IJK26_10000 [Clostridia bacterium]|nr:hypothetical protein [Clostridia bacterium]